MSGEPEVRLVGEAELGVEEHPFQQMERERNRIDRERRCIAQLQKDSRTARSVSENSKTLY